MSRLQTNIIRLESVGSTNTEAAKLALAGAAEGTLVVAREQTAGRGRLDRRWVSIKDAGLYLSLILRPQLELKSFPLITLMASLAVREALETATGLHPDIKWPNDILVNDRKLCGILAETVEKTGARAVILGIGINLTADSFPDELSEQATSVESISGKRADAEALLQALIEALAHRYEKLHSVGGPDAIVTEWQRASSFAQGKHIRVLHNGEDLEGITCGLEPDGALRVQTTDGRIEIVHAGDVSAVRPLPDKSSNG